MSLRGTYAWAEKVAKDFNFNGSFDERNGKLHIKGTVDTQDKANKIWDAIKTIPTWQQDVVADVHSTNTGTSEKTYTVKAGDTLSAIAKEHLGSANAYPKIFEANRDQLSDPNKIMPGQVLKIPTA
jgi:nucleoid-associated protein YgaU